MSNSEFSGLAVRRPRRDDIPAAADPLMLVSASGVRHHVRIRRADPNRELDVVLEVATRCTRVLPEDQQPDPELRRPAAEEAR